MFRFQDVGQALAAQRCAAGTGLTESLKADTVCLPSGSVIKSCAKDRIPFTPPDFLLFSHCSLRPHPVLRCIGCERIAPVTHQDQATWRCSAVALAAQAAPEERWCRFVSNALHRFVAADLPAPTPCWLTLQAIRLTARGTASGIPFRLVAQAPGPLPDLPPPSTLMQNNAPDRTVGAP